MLQRPLEDWKVKRINQLSYDQKLTQSVIAERLGISRFAVRTNLLSADQWKEAKARLNVQSDVTQTKSGSQKPLF